MSMQTFILQMASKMQCSLTNTHLLPAILSSFSSCVKRANSSSVIRFEPPPDAILLRDMQSIVYQKKPLSMT